LLLDREFNTSREGDFFIDSAEPAKISFLDSEGRIGVPSDFMLFVVGLYEESGMPAAFFIPTGASGLLCVGLPNDAIPQEFCTRNLHATFLQLTTNNK
jgi:hypothetical protein